MKNTANTRIGVASVALAVGVAVGLRSIARPGWLVAGLVAVNITTFALYGYDKLAARRRWWRVPEALLHGWALLGGSPAALIGQQVFRHKTIKQRFRVVFWLVVAVQIAALLAWLRLRRGA